MKAKPRITKNQLKAYLYDRWDVTFPELLEELKIPVANEERVKRFLSQLEEAGWIEKSYCGTCQTEEYDPGEEQMKELKAGIRH